MLQLRHRVTGDNLGRFWRSHLLHLLETALEQQQWQEADKITAQLMLKAANQTIALTPED